MMKDTILFLWGQIAEYCNISKVYIVGKNYLIVHLLFKNKKLNIVLVESVFTKDINSFKSFIDYI